MRMLLCSIWLAMAAGCGAQEIRQQAEESHEDRRVSGIVPGHGTMAIRGDVQIQIVLGEEMVGTLPRVHLTSQDRTWSPACHLDETGKWVTCNPIDDLPREQVFDLEVGMHDQSPLTVSLSSEFPADSKGYLLNSGASITHFGQDFATAERVGELFRSSDIAVLIDGYDGAPGAYNLLAGPVELKDSGKASVRSPGLTFVKHIQIREDGSFSSTPQSVFMPVFVNTGFVQLLIQNCQVHGQIEDDEIRGLRIDGDIPAISLVQLAEPLGPASSIVLGNITMDVDLDGDGEDDAAYFSLVSNAPQVPMVQY